MNVSRYIDEQEATVLDKFFSHDELEATKEEREDKLGEVEVDPFSDTEEGDELDDNPENQLEDSPTEYSCPCSQSLPPAYTQTRVSVRKRKRRDDDTFEYH
jgi:hypothetical protein